jgi:hypothetical protein
VSIRTVDIAAPLWDIKLLAFVCVFLAQTFILDILVIALYILHNSSILSHLEIIGTFDPYIYAAHFYLSLICRPLPITLKNTQIRRIFLSNAQSPIPMSFHESGGRSVVVEWQV